MKKKIFSIILIISFILSFSSLSVFGAETDGYITFKTADGSYILNSIRFEDFNNLDFIEYSIGFVPKYDSNNNIYDFRNYLFLTIVYRDGSWQSHYYEAPETNDYGFSDTINSPTPLCNFNLDIFSDEWSYFSDVPGYLFEDVLHSFVVSQNDYNVGYIFNYDYNNYSDGFVYYAGSLTQSSFTAGLGFNYYFYLSSGYTYTYNLKDANNNSIFTEYLYPGWVDVSFSESKEGSVTMVTNYVNTSFSHPQYTFQKGNYVGVTDNPYIASFSAFTDYYFLKYFSRYEMPYPVVSYFPFVLGDNTDLYLVTGSNSGGGSSDNTFDNGYQLGDQTGINNESNNIKDWIQGDSWTSQQKVNQFDLMMKDYHSLIKPNYNSSSVSLTDNDVASVNAFGTLMTPIFDNGFIVIRMVLLVFTIAFVSYVLFGKK